MHSGLPSTEKEETFQVVDHDGVFNEEHLAAAYRYYAKRVEPVVNGDTTHPDYPALSSYHLVIASGLDETVDYLVLMPFEGIAKYHFIVAQYGSSLVIEGMTMSREHGRVTGIILRHMFAICVGRNNHCNQH